MLAYDSRHLGALVFGFEGEGEQEAAVAVEEWWKR